MIKKSVKLSEIAHSRGQQYNKIGNRAFAEVSALVAFLKTAEAAGAHAAQARHERHRCCRSRALAQPLVTAQQQSHRAVVPAARAGHFFPIVFSSSEVC